MAVKIRLKRMGKVRAPHYRIVVVDSRKKRDGKVIEEIGLYHPKEDPSYISVVSERAQYWLGVGAQPSEAVAADPEDHRRLADVQGLPDTEGTLRVAEPKRDKLEIFNEALKDAASEPKAEAVTKRTTKKSAAKKAAAPAEPAAEEPAAETPVEAAAEARPLRHPLRRSRLRPRPSRRSRPRCPRSRRPQVRPTRPRPPRPRRPTPTRKTDEA